ncbi:hypothetical protein ACFFLS_06200 [Flavobacterium procerum]|uniref:SEC-C domain-containing protein n=1 Tax=Flavobacterium procerum TaxID=1455569 RepID=A0ABV6BMG3_9FLAO
MLQDLKIQKLISKLQISSKPQLLPVKVESFSMFLNCYGNVEQKIKKDGGRIRYGWQIHLKELLCEAEHHAVWENEKGQLICITPNQDNKEQILFFLDDEKVWEGKNIGNVRVNATNNELVDEFIKVCDALDVLYNFSNRVNDFELKIKPDIAKIIADFEYTKNVYYTRIVYGDTINSPCFCKSGKTYSNCHKIALPSLIEQYMIDVKRIYENN